MAYTGCRDQVRLLDWYPESDIKAHARVDEALAWFPGNLCCRLFYYSVRHALCCSSKSNSISHALTHSHTHTHHSSLYNCSVAIMKYLISKYNLPENWYPSDLKQRARVDEFIGWYHGSSMHLQGMKTLSFDQIALSSAAH